MSGILEKINRLAFLTENEFVLQWKRSGKKVMGYFCSYIPEEIFTAAGVLPFRMRGIDSGGMDLANAYYSSKNCSFPKSILNKILRGDYRFLDGLVFMNGCDPWLTIIMTSCWGMTC